MLEGRREAQREEKYLPTQLSLEHEKVSTTQTSNQEKRGQCIAQCAIMSKDLDLITSVSASVASSGAMNLFSSLSMGAISLSSSTSLPQPCKLSRKMMSLINCRSDQESLDLMQSLTLWQYLSYLEE